MIALVDDDKDGKVSFREFLMIFRKQQEGEIESDSGLDKLVKLTEIDVSATVLKKFLTFKIGSPIFLIKTNYEKMVRSRLKF